ncbi:fatty acid desaturase [Myxococcus sp. MISCRS1]|uniref:fatty acid desaturase family protein n=1 Tax=Myxococcus sp. MISCRS1 TaxID=2996786 RepID=UPI00226FFC24|nr:fatty acid desaturase [Myxococcus sp. MISCRS1]MCY1000956.1 fatty acid desaturase [Myxococcus sp. MISCRS1]
MTAHPTPHTPHPAPTARWQPRTTRSLLHVVGTAGAYLLLTAASYVALARSMALGLGLAVLAGITLVRVFILQHDCSHRSLFARPSMNDRVGTWLGLLTLAPHAYWRAMHLVHHSTSGDLERRGTGDIVTMTADEYQALRPVERLRYRIYRHPAVLLGIGPVFQFMFRFRLPTLVARSRVPERRSIWVTNLALVAVHAAFLAFGDWPRFFLMHLLITQVAAGLGIWLFFVQHQVEEPYWVPHARWTLKDSALKGSSFLVLPRVLEWTFGAINLHHVHHLKPQVPGYLLRDYMQQHDLEGHGVRLGLFESLKAFRLKVYDASQGRMTGFPPTPPRGAPALLAAPAPSPGRLDRLLTLSGEEH